MKIGLIGAGRLGICLALLIEKAGYEVLASDSRGDYIHELQQGIVTTSEPEVAQYVWNAKNIEFTVSNERVIKECDIIFTLVSTPSLEDGSYDVSNVDEVVSQINQNGSGLTGKSFVIGCTTNPGDCERYQRILEDDGIDVYYNPEFIAQGSIIRDLQNADMVLIGGSGHHVPVLEDIYKKIQVNEPSIHFMSTKAAELTKIAVNCYLTTKISYANMIGQVLSLSGMDDEIKTVLKAIGSDDRIGKKYLNFGYGFGGPCFPRDNRAFAAYAQKVGVEHNIGTTTDNFNDAHAKFMVEYAIKKNATHRPFCFKYLTYKPDTDILTESQQYRLCVDLLDKGYKVYCIDDQQKEKLDARIEFIGAPMEDVCWIDL